MDSILCDYYQNDDLNLNEYYYYNIMNKLLIASLVSIASITFTSWFIGKYLMEEYIEEEKPKQLFEDKYSLKIMEYDLSRNNNVTKNTSVMENTPNGNVILRYNAEREGFEYWADTKNVKFDYLETVARKFVIMNFCTKLYIDRRENIKKQQEEYDASLETGNPKEEDKEETIRESVFITKKPKKKKKKIDRNKIVANKSNKYLYVGKINEFNWLKKNDKKERQEKEISFASFKAKIFG